jgi:hypothetical protein
VSTLLANNESIVSSLFCLSYDGPRMPSEREIQFK